jgi:hypothetical protein
MGGRADGEQGLILVGRQILRAEQVFAESEEFPQLVTEGG